MVLERSNFIRRDKPLRFSSSC